MKIIAELDAAALLTLPKICEDIQPWQPLRVQKDSLATTGGVTSLLGFNTGIVAELVYRSSQHTKTKIYLFTAFKLNTYGPERIYQLEVLQTSRRVHDAHKRSHEHLGSRRFYGDETWSSWGYDEVLSHFCERTRITFKPAPLDPALSDFRRKS